MSELDPITAYADDPINMTVHHPYSAFDQGYQAAKAGFKADQNPYAGDQWAEHMPQYWLDGWELWHQEQRAASRDNTESQE